MNFTRRIKLKTKDCPTGTNILCKGQVLTITMLRIRPQQKLTPQSSFAISTWCPRNDPRLIFHPYFYTSYNSADTCILTSICRRSQFCHAVYSSPASAMLLCVSNHVIALAPPLMPYARFQPIACDIRTSVFM